MPSMKLRVYLIALLLAFFASNVTPVLAQDEPEEMEESEGQGKKKKKGKKAKKKSRKSKSRTSKEADEDELTEESAEDSEPEAKAKPSTPKVVEALGKFKIFNSKPNLKADYYIYFFTSSTCVHCVQCMPIAVEQYKKMKATRKVELLVVCADNTEDEAKKYLKKSKLKAPCIMFKDLQATNFQGLPSVGMPIPPSVAIVSKEGKMLKNGVGGGQAQETLKAWRDFTIGGK